MLGPACLRIVYKNHDYIHVRDCLYIQTCQFFCRNRTRLDLSKFAHIRRIGRSTDP